MRQIYLAGPDVFLASAHEVADAKRALCRRYGFEGLHPMDNDIPGGTMPGRIAARKIYEANVALMQRADLCIANLSPFRGPNVDDGTAFEVGYMIACGKPVWGYDNGGAVYDAKVAAYRAVAMDPYASVEPFGLPANLMLTIGIEAAGGQVFSATDALAAEDLSVFETCLAALARQDRGSVAAHG